MSSLRELAQRVTESGQADLHVRKSLSTIDELEPRLGCLLHSDREFVEQQLRSLQSRLAGGEELPLAGVPIVLKDNICVKGQKTTCASQMLGNFVPPYDATVWQKLQKAGAILVGKANMDEFAMGSSTENSAFGVTRNPWDTERVPGGSSGGSAAAVSAGYVPVSLGSDTGGSIRQPASFCGITGLKPTYGTVSRYGLVAFASSLDQIGPFARSAEDAARLLACIAGYDPMDATSSEQEIDPELLQLENTAALKGARLALPRVVSTLLPEELQDTFQATVEEFRKLGAEVEEVDLPYMEESLSAYYVIAPAEASSNLARYDGVRYGQRPQGEFETISELTTRTRSEMFGKEVKRRIMLGTYTLSAGYYDAYYNRAQKVRTALRNAYVETLKNFTAILTPTTPGPAFKIGEKVDDPVAMYLSDIFTVSANLTGLPALSVPSRLYQGLPLGVQLLGRPFADKELLTLARDYQRATDHHLQTPELAVHG
ncbi:MAG: Asp-tRNA(Asn)/Glu-tRNA(Gln) amidotransferase subunit GatA [Vulcanimicrobiota bacterium]